jgi:hypothetical protein
MTFQRLRPLGLVILALVLTACDGGRKSLPDTTVRVLNTVPRYLSLDFRREESGASTLEFEGGAAAAYDEDTYDFNVDAHNVVTGAVQRILSFPQKVSTGVTYTFVLYDTGTAVDRVVLEAPDLPVSAADTQVAALHAANGLPAMDIYIAAPGTNIAGTTPWGTIGFLQQIAPRRIAAGDYEITVTAAGNAANVLLTTGTFTLPAARTASFVIAPSGGRGNAPFDVVAMGEAASPLVDRNAPASLRVINAPLDQAPRDIAIDGQFSPALFSAVPFTGETAYATVPAAATLKVNVTPPGNPGVLELDTTIATGGTTLYTMLVTGTAGALKQLLFPDDGRRIPDLAKMRFYDTAPQAAAIDFVIGPAGTDFATEVPLSVLSAPDGSAQLNLLPGDYQLALRLTGTTTILAGPIPITIAGGGIYGVLATNNVNGVSVDITLLHDFP